MKRRHKQSRYDDRSNDRRSARPGDTDAFYGYKIGDKVQSCANHSWEGTVVKVHHSVVFVDWLKQGVYSDMIPMKDIRPLAGEEKEEERQSMTGESEEEFSDFAKMIAEAVTKKEKTR